MASRHLLRRLGGMLALWLILVGCRSAPAPAREEAVEFLRGYLLPDERLAIADAALSASFPGQEVVALPQGDAMEWRAALRREGADELLLPLDTRQALLAHDPWFRRHYRLVHRVEPPEPGEVGWAIYTALPHPEEEAEWHPVGQRLATPGGGQLSLAAYRLSAGPHPDEAGMALALRWCVEADLTTALAMEVELTDLEGGPLARDIDWPDQLHTERWKQGLCLTTEHALPALAALPEGQYALRLAFDPPLVLSGEPVRTTPLTLTTLTRLPDVRLSPPPAPTHPMSATFGSAIGFLGYDAPLRLAPGQTLPIVLYWQAKAPVPFDAKVFVHLLTPQGQLVAQADGVPLQWQYPTGRWQPGEFICDRYTLDLNRLPRGDYLLAVGFYDPATGERLPVTAPQADAAQRHLRLGIVSIR